MKTFKTFIAEAVDPKNQEFYNDMYSRIHGAATRKGVSNPEVIARLGAAQASLETGYGKHMVGKNVFGIKGEGPAGSVSAKTREVIGAQDQYINDRFRKYDDYDQAADDYIDFLHKNKRYKDVVSAADIDTAISAQGRSGYATDPRYGEILAQIHKQRSSGAQTIDSQSGTQRREPGYKPVADKSSFEVGTQKREPDSYKEKQQFDGQNIEQDSEDDIRDTIENMKKSQIAQKTNDSTLDPNTGKRLQFLRPQKQR